MKNNTGVIALLGLILILIVVSVNLSGCSTVAGAGKDITGAAEWTKEKFTGPVKTEAK